MTVIPEARAVDVPDEVTDGQALALLVRERGPGRPAARRHRRTC
ncbi:hypothetical protein [Kribbella qitaiheensis]|nr:hypothetical protein [Kribbella qitaiheensis]